MKNKNKIKLTIFIIIIIFFAYNKILNDKNISLPNMDKSIEKMSRKTITRDAVVKKIQEKQDLITMEVELNNKVILDDSWGNLDIFKKVISIDFYGTGIYTVDLAKLNRENVLIQPSKTITIRIPKPKVKSITLNEDKTTFKTENGLFRFGEIKITPAENQILSKKAKEKMNEQLNEKHLVESALSKTKKSIEKSIHSILLPYENYNIVIKFIDS
ncbi:DUF4230 domain-containing protein [Clostridium tetani]|uniref:DUF4230 domain-containing protein n=1 Tax=Clostridium tetani TaxID=1513 RepID=A0ABY0EWH0_CLOTA|nr:DUF4230 domain-containing protein [Clostridium tetani]KHO40508.1 hypothetical protein OR62_00030 [Clostridium tetani]RXI38986.1 DUF4230 domain-containing protein [Clostridium tetani]RXI59189.1 DUF4230 domain-containing protein [Clostridium tetani]RXI71284.1 DUF4230 domain-containing protein [Clostridium tetani]